MFYSATSGGFYEQKTDTNLTDLVEISDSEHAALLAAESAGQIITHSTDGVPVASNPAPIARPVLLNQWYQKIDTAAGNARVRFVSAGDYLDAEYQLTVSQLTAWRAAGSPSDNVPESVQAWADAQGITPAAAATDIETIANRWNTGLLAIRRLRLTGKAAIETADVNANLSAIAQSTIDALNNLTPA